MLLIKNGTLVNPRTSHYEKMDILLDGERIVHVDKAIHQESSVEIIDATGMIITPGFIDLHVHLREPGFEEKETIYTGSRACAKGGYTSVVCMPNTKPALDSVETIAHLQEIIKRDSVISIYPAGAITKGIAGEVLTDHVALINAGVVTLSDDGRTTMNTEFMENAFKASRKHNIPVMTHSEDHQITVNFKNEIFPTEAESNIVKRDIELCKKTKGILHVSHVSTKVAIDAIMTAKKEGIEVTCEAAPHHFALSTEMVDMHSTMSKVNPPIRSNEDRKVIVDAIKNGIIDVIATDHAPHDLKSKELPYGDASFGISGIESAFCISYKTLVESGEITLLHLIEMLTNKPAKIGRLKEVGSIEVGYYADIAIIDLNKEVIIDSRDFISKGKNTPFNGFIGKGEVVKTLHHGRVVYSK